MCLTAGPMGRPQPDREHLSTNPKQASCCPPSSSLALWEAGAPAQPSHLLFHCYYRVTAEATMASPGLLGLESFPGFQTGTLSFLLLLPPLTSEPDPPI